MARAGNTGGHLTSGSSHFIAKYVAPLLALKVWNDESIGAVMTNGDGEGPHAPATSPTRPAAGAPVTPATRPVSHPSLLPASRPAAATLPAEPPRGRLSTP
jgi:hypothetical protein